jgi:hypothetical protein
MNQYEIGFGWREQQIRQIRPDDEIELIEPEDEDEAYRVHWNENEMTWEQFRDEYTLFCHDHDIIPF